MRVDNDCRRRVSLLIDQRLLEDLLYIELNHVVERERQIGARLFVSRVLHVNDLAGRIPDDCLLAALPAQLLVVERLEPGDATVVYTRITDHLRGECSLWVDPFRIADVAEAGELEPLERPGLIGGSLPLDVGEAAGVASQGLLQRPGRRPFEA